MVGVEPLGGAVVDRQHVVLGGLDEPEPLQLGQHLGLLGREVVGLAVVAAAVVELPDVVVERRQLAADHDPRRLVLGDRAPAPVVDAAVAEHLEVLQVVALRGVGVVEGVEHARALHGRLLHAVDHRRLGQPGRLEDRRRHVDDVGELRAQAAAARRCRRASARWCRCGCRPSARRPAWSTGTGCPSPTPSRPRSGCRSSGEPNSSILLSMNSGVSSAAMPLKLAISLKAPLRVPSADAPLSPMM